MACSCDTLTQRYAHGCYKEPAPSTKQKRGQFKHGEALDTRKLRAQSGKKPWLGVKSYTAAEMGG